MSNLRSRAWYGRNDRDGFTHRSWMKNQGWPHDVFSRPVIGICNTWSELNPCNAHFRELAEWVKRGVWEAGGFPLEFPVMSLGESQLRPTAMLFRNLAPNGAVIKPSAAGPHLLQHTGRAVVFENIEEFHARVNDDSLDIDEDCVMVLKNCGPRGYPGMAEVGNMPIPAKLLRKGITDMVRVSDARMSGTAYGTVVLHVSPEATVGGPLALVHSGDMITLDVPGRLIQLGVDDATLSQRRMQWTPPPGPQRGWAKLYFDHVLQAHEGADLDFLVGCSGAPIPRDSH
jgi:dihydroxyacid dehydratase/phosphogluconate dehydratase